MLLLLFGAWFLLSGSDPKDSAWLLQDIGRTRANASRAVTGSQRRDEVLKTIDRMKAVDARQAARTNATHEKLLAHAAKRATPSADLVKQLEALDDDGRAAADQLIDLRFAAKDRMSREEWQAVFKTTD
jgi:hypothetical protein